MDHTKFPERCDVLIVGMGPVGAALANLLGLQGVHVLAVDKAPEIFTAPRAIALDNEALRILQMCGLEEGDLDTVAIPEVRMLSPFFGQYARAITAGGIDGHPRLITFYQPQLEAILRRRAAALDKVCVQLGVELVDFRQSEAGVTVRLRGAEVGERVVQARYLVGADGAGSPVRQQLGLGFEGKTYTEDWLVVDARNVAESIGHVEFICDHQRPTPHMVAPGGRQRWEFKLRPGETREQMEHPDKVRELLFPWTHGHQPEIERVAVYRFHARLVDRFRSGRVFLAGDAAHITPPFVGQGLVAGLRDVANLAWKLAWALKDRAHESVLDSYDQERRPHARSMIRLARFMGKLVMPGNAVAAFAVHGLMTLVTRIPRLRRLFENLEIKPAQQYRQGCFAQPARASLLQRGGTFPQAWLRSADQRVKLSDNLLGRGFVAIGFGCDPTVHLSPTERQAWRDLGGRFVQIEPQGCAAGVSGADLVCEDFTGNFIPRHATVGHVAFVRPDRIVLHDCEAEHAAKALAESLSLLGRTPPGLTHEQLPTNGDRRVLSS